MHHINIHQDIKDKISYFIKTRKIPHIVFHGPSGAGKRNTLSYLIKSIYDGMKDYKNYIMYINCAHGKGIRFIRDELKFFAKLNIHNKNGQFFKSIILFNADKLTTDAQSALRRCIEQFSHTTRFFIVIDEYHKLLKPIVSRFCNIHVPLPIIDGKQQNLHKYNNQTFDAAMSTQNNKRKAWLTKNIEDSKNYTSHIKSAKLVNKLYEKSYSAVDIMHVIESTKKLEDTEKYGLLIHFDDVRREFRNEKLLMLYLLTFAFMRPDCNLENIETM